MQEERPIRLVTDEVVLFAEECILFVLRYHNIDWNPFSGYEDRRRFAQFHIFTPEIGRTLVDPCMIDSSKQLAALTGFNEEGWLQMNPSDKFVIDQCFDRFLLVEEPDEFCSHFYLWSFACYLCHKAAQQYKTKHIQDVLAELVNKKFEVFNSLQYYELLHSRAFCYNFVHMLKHNLISDEGYMSEVDSVSDDE